MDLISLNKQWFATKPHQHNAFITKILWLEYWLEQQEASLAPDVEFKVGRWIQGINALIGLYSRLEEITTHTQKVRPITINVVKPHHECWEIIIATEPKL